MFFEQNTKEGKENALDQIIAKNDRATQELMIRMDVLDREIKTLMDELQVTPQQVSIFVSNEENFTPDNWEELQNQRRMLDEKLTRELDNVKNPQKSQRRQADRQVARHWLFVR